MVVRLHSQNPWQLASPHSSVAADGCGASAGGVDESGALAPAAFRARQLMEENILGLRSTRQGESAVPHNKCLHSSATSSCRMCTNQPILHDRACSTDILTPQPSQAAGISSGEWLYRRRMLSLHSSVDRPVPFNQFGKTESHAPAAQFCLSCLATDRVCPGRGGRGRSAHSGADPFELPCLLWWRTYDKPPGQTEWQGPQGTLSDDELPQERPCEHSGRCPQDCGLPAPQT